VFEEEADSSRLLLAMRVYLREDPNRCECQSCGMRKWLIDMLLWDPQVLVGNNEVKKTKPR
jgi:hypothetical protein